MQRLMPYLGLAIIVLAFLVLADVTVNYSDTTGLAIRISTSTPTLFVEPSFTMPEIMLPDLSPETVELEATSTKKVTVPSAKKPEQEPPPPTPVLVPVIVPVLIPPPSSGGNVALDAAATALRAALVNIICYAPAGGPIHSISGSGVFIDQKGIILTNAHVAQYFLLADRGVSCTIRAGSPASDSYSAALVYISPAWISANATILTQVAPRGTGERDFALLAVTKSITNAALPTAFPYVELAKTPPASGTSVVIATYGAQFLVSSQIQSGLFPTVVFGSVKDIFTFDTNTIDVFALGGSAAAQEGSSGGGVADVSGKLIGTITTSTVTGLTDTRSLDAITASYIRSDYASETGQPLDLLLERDPSTAAADFAPQIPTLESIITASLPR